MTARGRSFLSVVAAGIVAAGIGLIGVQQVHALTATTTTLSSSVNPSTPAQTITLSATVAGTGGTPTGTVAFTGDGTTIGGCASATMSGGVATCNWSSSTSGSHTIVATYGGDGTFASSNTSNFQWIEGAGTELAGWGLNDEGQLSNGTTSDQPNPVAFGNLISVTQASNGGRGTSGATTLALDPGGHVWASGFNGSGQLGNDTGSNSSSPVEVCAPTGCGTYLSNIIQVVESQYKNSYALDSNGHVWAWGSNDSGQIGNGVEDGLAYELPSEVCSPAGCGSGFLSNIIQIASHDSGYYNYALDSSGHVWAWGNPDYSLGNGTTTVEDRIRCGKDTGMRNPPFHGLAENAAWLAIVLIAQDLLAWMQKALLARGGSAVGAQTFATSAAPHRRTIGTERAPHHASFTGVVAVG